MLYIQNHFASDEFDKMLEYYPSLVEACIEFKVYSRKVIAQSREEEYYSERDHEKCDISSLYRLVKDNRTKYESTNPDKVLDGQIDDFLENFLYTKNDYYRRQATITSEIVETQPSAKTHNIIKCLKIEIWASG